MNEPVYREETTVYALTDERGRQVNRWSANVQGGGPKGADYHKRTEIARRITALLNDPTLSALTVEEIEAGAVARLVQAAEGSFPCMDDPETATELDDALAPFRTPGRDAGGKTDG